MPQIHFNGKTYNDIAEMPATERQAYEQLMSIFKDENQDGVPDVFQGDVVGNLVRAATTMNVIVDGKPVSGLSQMSPEQRAKLEKGLSKLQELGILSQVPDLSKVEQVPTWEDAEIRPSKPIIPTQSAIQEENTTRLLIPVLVLVVLLACGVVVAAYLLMGQGF